MESNLRVYPEFNYMSLFGLGALNLYSQNLSLGSKYLQGARDVALHFNQTYDFLVEDQVELAISLSDSISDPRISKIF